MNLLFRLQSGCVISVVSSWGLRCVQQNLPLRLNQFYLYSNYLLSLLPSKLKLYQYHVLLYGLFLWPI